MNPPPPAGADESKLLAVLEFDTAASPPRFHYEIWQAGGGLLERRELSYDEVRGRQRILHERAKDSQAQPQHRQNAHTPEA